MTVDYMRLMQKTLAEITRSGADEKQMVEFLGKYRK
jgi:hypothetical protein